MDFKDIKDLFMTMNKNEKLTNKLIWAAIALMALYEFAPILNAISNLINVLHK